MDGGKEGSGVFGVSRDDAAPSLDVVGSSQRNSPPRAASAYLKPLWVFAYKLNNHRLKAGGLK